MNDLTLNVDNDDLDGTTVTYSVHIVRNSECCGEEMKTADFDADIDVPNEIIDEMKRVVAENPDAEFEVQEDGVDALEEGGHRYAKSYFGFTLNMSILHEGKTLGSFDASDKVQASGMDEQF